MIRYLFKKIKKILFHSTERQTTKLVCFEDISTEKNPVRNR